MVSGTTSSGACASQPLQFPRCLAITPALRFLQPTPTRADFEEREIVATFARNAVPLDVLVVDMDW